MIGKLEREKVSFSDITKEIGGAFLKAKTEGFGGHPLAALIRRDWPKALEDALALSSPLPKSIYKFDASPGQGNWADAPWLAVFRVDVTTTATAGFYPVYLFEPRFDTVCLVLGQGAEKLTKAVGRRQALSELKHRANELRRLAGDWKAAGFTEGPFATMKHVSIRAEKDSPSDPWSVSVAFGKRYQLAEIPDDSTLTTDLRKMVHLYDRLAAQSTLKFSSIDAELDKLKEDGELPDGAVDGAKQVVWHKKIESRVRNPKLIAAVKSKLGSNCQACGFSFSSKYGPGMEGYIEAHHKTPLSTLPPEGAKLKATAEDFMVLCSNCHRAIHRRGCPDLETFRTSLVHSF